MMKDLELMFMNKKSMTNVASNPTTLSEIIDFKVPGQGKGRTAYVFITAHEDTTSATDPAINLYIATSDKPDLTGAVNVPLALPPITKADLAAGKTVQAQLPMDLKRYIRLGFSLNAGSLTALKWSAGITLDPQTNAADAV